MSLAELSILRGEFEKPVGVGVRRCREEGVAIDWWRDVIGWLMSTGWLEDFQWFGERYSRRQTVDV